MDMSLSKLRGIVKDRGAWRAIVHGVAKSWSQLSHWTTKCSPLVALGFHFYWVTISSTVCSLHRLPIELHTPCCSNAPCYRSSRSNPNYITSSPKQSNSSDTYNNQSFVQTQETFKTSDKVSTFFQEPVTGRFPSDCVVLHLVRGSAKMNTCKKQKQKQTNKKNSL